MLKDKMLEGLNDQITKELYSAYLYLSMAGWLEAKAMPGFAKWMRVQAQEESCHALIQFYYVCDAGGKVKMGVIDAPKAEFKSLAHVFEETLAHEKKVTASIHNLVDIAIKDRDHATKQFLEWFVKEQVEEEATASTWLEQIKRVADGNAVYLMDKEAGARVFALPAPLVGKV